MRRWGVALAGFASVYLFWLIPSYILNGNYWDRSAYIFGDHLVLPLFNAIAFNIFAGMRRSIALKILRIGLVVLVSSSFLIGLFESGAVHLREGHAVRAVDIYHSVFVLLEFSFILTVLLSYLWIERNRFNCKALFILFPSAAVFLGLVFLADAGHISGNFPVWQKIAAAIALFVIFIIALIRQMVSNR